MQLHAAPSSSTSQQERSQRPRACRSQQQRRRRRVALCAVLAAAAALSLGAPGVAASSRATSGALSGQAAGAAQPDAYAAAQSLAKAKALPPGQQGTDLDGDSAAVSQAVQQAVAGVMGGSASSAYPADSGSDSGSGSGSGSAAGLSARQIAQHPTFEQLLSYHNADAGARPSRRAPHAHLQSQHADPAAAANAQRRPLAARAGHNLQLLLSRAVHAQDAEQDSGTAAEAQAALQQSVRVRSPARRTEWLRRASEKAAAAAGKGDSSSSEDGSDSSTGDSSRKSAHKNQKPSKDEEDGSSDDGSSSDAPKKHKPLKTNAHADDSDSGSGSGSSSHLKKTPLPSGKKEKAAKKTSDDSASDSSSGSDSGSGSGDGKKHKSSKSSSSKSASKTKAKSSDSTDAAPTAAAAADAAASAYTTTMPVLATWSSGTSTWTATQDWTTATIVPSATQAAAGQAASKGAAAHDGSAAAAPADFAAPAAAGGAAGAAAAAGASATPQPPSKKQQMNAAAIISASSKAVAAVAAVQTDVPSLMNAAQQPQAPLNAVAMTNTAPSAQSNLWISPAPGQIFAGGQDVIVSWHSGTGKKVDSSAAQMRLCLLTASTDLQAALAGTLGSSACGAPTSPNVNTDPHGTSYSIIFSAPNVTAANSFFIMLDQVPLASANQLQQATDSSSSSSSGSGSGSESDSGYGSDSGSSSWSDSDSSSSESDSGSSDGWSSTRRQKSGKRDVLFARDASNVGSLLTPAFVLAPFGSPTTPAALDAMLPADGSSTGSGSGAPNSSFSNSRPENAVTQAAIAVPCALAGAAALAGLALWMYKRGRKSASKEASALREQEEQAREKAESARIAIGAPGYSVQRGPSKRVFGSAESQRYHNACASLSDAIVARSQSVAAQPVYADAYTQRPIGAGQTYMGAFNDSAPVLSYANQMPQGANLQRQNRFRKQHTCSTHYGLSRSSTLSSSGSRGTGCSCASRQNYVGGDAKHAEHMAAQDSLSRDPPIYNAAEFAPPVLTFTSPTATSTSGGSSFTYYSQEQKRPLPQEPMRPISTGMREAPPVRNIPLCASPSAAGFALFPPQTDAKISALPLSAAAVGARLPPLHARAPPRELPPLPNPYHAGEAAASKGAGVGVKSPGSLYSQESDSNSNSSDTPRVSPPRASVTQRAFSMAVGGKRPPATVSDEEEYAEAAPTAKAKGVNRRNSLASTASGSSVSVPAPTSDLYDKLRRVLGGGSTAESHSIV